MAKPQRLKHLLLLALRVLAVMSLVFLMARPILTESGLLSKGRGAGRVMLLDNSLSMGYREDRGERLAIAKRAAREIIEHSQEKIVLIPTSSTPEKNRQWLQPAEALKELDRISLSPGRGDPIPALGLAYRKLKELKRPGQVLILSDMTRGDWEGVRLSEIRDISADTAVTFIRVGGVGRDPNRTIRDVRLAEGEAVTGARLRFKVTVSNLSDEPGSALVQFYLSGAKKDQKSIDLKAMEDREAYFESSFDKPGLFDGEIRLAPDLHDHFIYDDVFHFSITIRDKIRILVVDGDPRMALRTAESYYFVNALCPGQGEESPFSIRVMTESQFRDHDLRPYDGVVLLNVARPEPSKLIAAGEQKKPIFIFLGNHVVPEEYNNIPLFPWRIREGSDSTASKLEKIVSVDKIHKSLEPFFGPTEEGLKKASFYRHLKVEGSRKSLLTLQSGDPLLTEADFGKGKIFLFTSSSGPGWSDLALRAAYVPIVQGLIKEGVGLGETGELKAGDNSPPEESDLRKVTLEEIRKEFGLLDLKMVQYQEGQLRSARGGKKELWPLLLAFLLLVLAVEMGIANWAVAERSKARVKPFEL